MTKTKNAAEPEPKNAWTTSEIQDALEARYSGNAWAIVWEVRNATGIAGDRAADALAFSLWPSRGLEMLGFEIKASRSDWLRELKKPEKADDIARYCDRWYVVVGHASIVKTGELPAAWGLMVPDKTGKALEVVVEAPKNPKPLPVDRAFTASLFRAASGINERANRRSHDAGYKSGLEQSGWEYKQLKEAVAKFEEVSGIKISEHAWTAGNIGEAVRAVIDGHLLQLKKHVDEFEVKAGVKVGQWNSGDVGEAVRLVLNMKNRGFKNTLERLGEQVKELSESVEKMLAEPKVEVADGEEVAS